MNQPVIEIPDMFHDAYFEADIEKLPLKQLQGLKVLLDELLPKILTFFRWLIEQKVAEPQHRCQTQIDALRDFLLKQGNTELASELADLTQTQWDQILNDFHLLARAYAARYKEVDACLAKRKSDTS